MKTLHRVALSSFATSLLALNLGTVLADSDEAALKKLEQAVSHSGSAHKPAKRSIVFDNEPPAAAASKQDCANLPPDVEATAVDFTIQFKVGSAALAPSSIATVSSIAQILALSPERCVLVEGHTDASGNADKNLNLSRARAETVTSFIAQKGGVERSRLVPIGKGSSAPLANLDPRDPRNRRVVFKVVAN